MQYLTPSDLRTAAPAAQKLPQSDDNLISTASFLRHMGGEGYKPVFAAQGTPHADSDTKLKSRHLVVTAYDDGTCIAILNSHTVWRRAWLGAGYSWGGTGDNDALFMLGAVVPLPRWRGFEEPLAKLVALQADVRHVINELGTWRPETHQVRWMGKKMASTAYFKGHRKPLVPALTHGLANTATGLTYVVQMYQRIVEGGLTPEPTGKFQPPRKLKPIIAPDALMLASNAAFLAGVAALKKYRATARLGDIDFPTFRGYQKA
jgi:hypothetical protein